MSEERIGPARRRWLPAALVLVLGAAGATALVLLRPGPERVRAPAPPRVTVAPVRPAGAHLTLHTEGFVRSRDTVDLVAEVEGRVLRLAPGFATGARYAAGTELLVVDPAPYRARLQEARAALRGARSEFERARDQLARIERLAARDLDSEARLDRARVTRDRARAAVDEARARLRRARIALDDTVVRAPFETLVVEEHVAEGRYLAPGESVARLAAADRAEIEVGLAPAQADLLRRPGVRAAGLEAAVGPVGAARGASVDRLQPRFDPRTRTLDAVVRVPDPFDAGAEGAPALRLGALVPVRLRVPAGPGWWTVPGTAVGGDDRLWRLRGDDRLEPVSVDVALRDAGRALVRSQALAEGDRVLLTDLRRLAPDLRVEVVPAQGAAPEADEGAGGDPDGNRPP